MDTLSELLQALEDENPLAPLVFVTDAGEISPGYHITELSHAAARGVDCGGHTEAWQEARLQLLDGYGGVHMTVGKFIDIIKKSIFALPELADAVLVVEFGHGNRDLRLMSLDAPEATGERVLIWMGAERATCKPADRMIRARSVARVSGAAERRACCA